MTLYTNEYKANGDSTTQFSILRSGIEVASRKMSNEDIAGLRLYIWTWNGETITTSDRSRSLLSHLVGFYDTNRSKPFPPIRYVNGDSHDLTRPNLWITPENVYSKLDNGNYILTTVSLIDGKEVPFSTTLTPEQYEICQRYRWFAKYYTNIVGYYLVATEKNVMIYLHRLLAGAAPGDGEIVDHKSGLTLCNEPGNLQKTTPTVNSRNRRKLANATSRHTGVSRRADNGRYQACVKIHGKTSHIGYFADEEDAGHARDEFIRSLPEELRIGFCYNFPRDGEAELRRPRIANEKHPEVTVVPIAMVPSVVRSKAYLDWDEIERAS